MIALTRFTESDWYSFAGAAKPVEGEPMTGGVRIDGEGWTTADLDEPSACIVVDRDKVQVLAAESVWELRCGYAAGLAAVQHLCEPLRVQQLQHLKFEQIA